MFGAFVRWIRQDAGVSLEDFAKRLRLAPAELEAVETGERSVERHEPLWWLMVEELVDLHNPELVDD